MREHPGPAAQSALSTIKAARTTAIETQLMLPSERGKDALHHAATAISGRGTHAARRYPEDDYAVNWLATTVHTLHSASNEKPWAGWFTAGCGRKLDIHVFVESRAKLRGYLDFFFLREGGY